ncbi:MAG: hypothetical protein AB7T74_05765 [Clostridia bacterium]
MPAVFDKLQENYLGYAAIFVCIGVGFLVLRKINKDETGLEYWSVAFFLNSMGFVFWAGAIPISPRAFYILGELSHAAGFILLVAGAYRFGAHQYKLWHPIVLCSLLAVWGLALAMFRTHAIIAGLALRGLRAFLFLLAGSMLVIKGRKEKAIGTNLAGGSLMVWGSFVVVFSFIRININLFQGLLVGFHILSAFGMVAMIMDSIRIRAETSQKQLETLQGILPICAYCKKIRDDQNKWHVLESYIEKRSEAEFSHGICPECFDKHRPDK